MGKFERLFELNKFLFRIFGFLLSVRRIRLLWKNKKSLRKNAEIKSLKNSKKCFVIGLGPSLKKIDLKKLDGDLIVTNRFNKVEGSKNIKPVAYVLLDNFFYNGKYKDDLLGAINDFSDSFFVLNGAYRDNIDSSVLANVKHAFIYCWKGFLNGKKDNLDLAKLLPIMNNVACAAEVVALYMGYEEICLLGCDFNSFASLKKEHVYKEKNEERLWSMSNELFQYAFAADLHHQLDIYSRRRGQRIYNLTEGSLIDAYERKNCDQYKNENT